MHIIITAEKTVFDFDTSAETRLWRIVSDSVMGGISDGQIDCQWPGIARFRGHISLENFGGFVMASTKQLQYRLEDYKGLILKVKGDGKTYSFRIKTALEEHGIAYRHDFATKAGEWGEIQLSFKDFQPTYRGKVLAHIGKLDTYHIRELGLLIGQKQEGSFSIEIDWIKAYR